MSPEPYRAPTGVPRGRSVAVTGAASGIGRQLVLDLLGEGVPVGAFDRDEALLGKLREAAPPGAKLLTHAGSVSDLAAVEAGFGRFERELGPLWGVVACAGIVRDKTMLKMTEEEWRVVLDVNLTGTYFAFRAGAARIKEQKGGRLVAFSSIVGLRGGFGQANYAASKAGVLGLVKTAAKELGRHGITVNALAPGYVRTPMTAAYGDVLEEASKQMSPLAKVAEPQDISGVVRFLLSPAAGHITGVVLRVDAGQAI
jgi:NAD(P)-dependent dehydrogenase (short-subunit alcohol dehydrogenase family)